MLYNNISDTLDTITYIDKDSYCIDKIDKDNNLIDRIWICSNSRLDNSNLDLFISTSNILVMDSLRSSVDSTDTLLNIIQIYNPEIIYIPVEFISNLVKDNNSIIKSMSKNKINLGLIINKVQDLVDLLRLLNEKEQEPIIDTIVFNVVDHKIFEIEFNRVLIDLIKYDLKNMVILNLNPKQPTVLRMESDSRIKRIVIDFHTEIVEDLTVSKLKIDGSNVGLIAPLDFMRMKNNLDDWASVIINTSSPYFGHEPEIRDGGKYSKNNRYYHISGGKVRHPTLEKDYFNKVIYNILNIERNEK